MAWDLTFIAKKDFKKHVQATILKYGEKLESFDLKRFVIGRNILWRVALFNSCVFTYTGASIMFSITVLLLKRLKCWNTMPILRRWMLMSTLKSAMSTPLKII